MLFMQTPWKKTLRVATGLLAFIALVFNAGCATDTSNPSPYPYQSYRVPHPNGGYAYRDFFPSLPSIPAQEAGIKVPRGYAGLILYRTQYSFGQFSLDADVAILLDGKKLGQLPNTSKIIVSVPEGRRRLQSGAIVVHPEEVLQQYPYVVSEQEQWSQLESGFDAVQGGIEFVAEAGQVYAFRFGTDFGGRNPPRPSDPRDALRESERLKLQQ